MKSKLLNWIETLRSSFWVMPSLMALSAIGLSYGAIALDSGPIGKKMANSLGWLWSGGAEGARSLLSTVASSMITVAGTVFSITIAALTLASSQFGPKLLRNFTQDTGNQVVLGTYSHLRLLPARVAHGPRPIGRGIRALPLGDRRAAVGARQPCRADLLHPPRRQCDTGREADRGRRRRTQGRHPQALSRTSASVGGAALAAVHDRAGPPGGNRPPWRLRTGNRPRRPRHVG